MPATIHHEMPESKADRKGAVTAFAEAGHVAGDHDLHSTADFHLVLAHGETFAGKTIAHLTLAQFMALPVAQSVYGALDEAKAAREAGHVYYPFFEVKPGWGTHDELPYQRLKDYGDKIGQAFGLMTLRRYPYDNSAAAQRWEASAVKRIAAMRSVGLPCGVLWHPTSGPGSTITDPNHPLLQAMAWVKAPPTRQTFRAGVIKIQQNSATPEIALERLSKVIYTPEAPVTTPAPVPAKRIDIATKYGLANVDAAAVACRKVGLPFYVACALLEQESRGKNVWGHDQGGLFAGLGDEVNEGAFRAFYYEVTQHGANSNGVGPCQITYAGALKAGKRDGGFFAQMFAADLRPWVPQDNMEFGFALLLKAFDDNGKSWAVAGHAYNGSAAYGDQLAAKVKAWRTRLGIS